MTKRSRSRKYFNKFLRERLTARRGATQRFAPSDSAPQLRLARAHIEITPPWGVDLGGLGPDAKFADKMLGRLYASVLLLDDGRGNRLLLIAADLHVGSRYISEHLGARLAQDIPELGVGVEQVWLLCSHTHSGPGHLYADYFYDAWTSGEIGFDKTTANWLVSKFYQTVRDWTDPSALVPVQMGVSSELLWGWLWNRSELAHLANRHRGQSDDNLARALGYPLSEDDKAYAEDCGKVFTGQPSPPQVDLGKRMVDPRVQTIVFSQPGRSDIPIAVIAVVHATPSILPGGARCLTGDVMEAASSLLRRRWRDRALPVSVVSGAMGDVNFVDAEKTVDEFRAIRQPRKELSDAQFEELWGILRRAAEALSQAVEKAVARALSGATTQVPLAVRFGEWDLIHARLDDGRRKLTYEHAIGRATLAGSELSRPQRNDRHAGLFHETSHKRWEAGRRVILPLRFDRHLSRIQREHTPKHTGDAAFINRYLPWVKGRAPGALFTLGHLIQLRYAKLGTVNLVAWPVEPTVGLSQQLVAELGQGKHDDWIVCGLVGGCVGYATTEMEYRVQDYEGASNLWGRHFGDWLIEKTAQLKRGGGRRLRNDARFATKPELDSPPIADPRRKRIPAQAPANDFSVVYDPQRQLLLGSWESRGVVGDAWQRNISDVGWILRLLGRGGAPVVCQGMEVCDCNFPFLIRRQMPSDRKLSRWDFRLSTQGLSLAPNDLLELSFEVTKSEPFRP